MAVKLCDVRAVQPDWFSRKNKKFFGDEAYRILHGKISKNPYLIRSTVACGYVVEKNKKLHFRVNLIDPVSLKIGTMFPEIFKSIDDVKEWLSTN